LENYFFIYRLFTFSFIYCYSDCEIEKIDGFLRGKFVGYIHQVVIDNYLTKHDTPEDIEFYFCGPPLMNQAVVKMCDDFGVPDENIRFDDFGG